MSSAHDTNKSQIEVMDTEPSMVTENSPWNRAYHLSNMKGKLSSKCNDTSNKPIANSLNRFVNFYLQMSINL